MRYFRSILITWLLLLLTGTMLTADAQEAGEWSAPYQLSAGVLNDVGQPAPTMSPVLAADRLGSVHAIFSAQIASGEDAKFDTLFYARFDGEKWTEPIDILYKSNRNFWLPQLAVDNEGLLHLIWIDGPKIMYSQAPIDAADLADSWSSPAEISDDAVRNASIIASSDGNLHISYCSKGETAKVAHIVSEDGNDWSSAVDISPVEGCWTRVAEDDLGRLHVVYSDQPGAGAGSAVYYSQSIDGGFSWYEPLKIDSKTESYLANYGPSWINIAAVGSDEIHIIWDGQPAGQRWHQYSLNGGESWSEPIQLTSNHRGLTEPNALSVDSAGGLHMLTLGWLDTEENPKGPFYTFRRDDQWSSIELIGERGDWDPEGGSAVVLKGNILVVGWRHETGDGNEVWVAQRILDTPEISPEPHPVSEALVTAPGSTEVPEAQSLAPTNSSEIDLSFESEPGSTFDSSDSILLATAIVFSLLGVIILLRFRRQARRH